MQLVTQLQEILGPFNKIKVAHLAVFKKESKLQVNAQNTKTHKYGKHSK
jgi:hypothetical protein